ncbi:TraB/GumN family protein [Sphingomonas sp.]|uniref:TraB/GumN family protein n=1 Tax=Sphingomonas sp. TaxID=28214 RepID=UPI00286D6B55|nr:TraB/GumN family protein [Sphingomonas sp.]
MSMIQFLIGAALAAATPQSTAPPPPAALPDAQPAMWVVNDEDTIIYLFGTFHALDEKSEWFNDEVKTAFTQSQQLVLEALVPAAPAAPVKGPLALRGRTPGTLPAVAGSPTFLTTTKQVMAAGRSQGMRSDSGADAVLRRAAEAAGKPVGALETPEFQLGMMRRMPSAARPDTPVQAAVELRQMGTVLAFLQAAWKRGDVDSFNVLLEDMRLKSPVSYKLLFRDRNERWAGWVADRLTQPGTVFVAVGAGHLSGPDSLQHKLADRNIRSARLN